MRRMRKLRPHAAAGGAVRPCRTVRALVVTAAAIVALAASSSPLDAQAAIDALETDLQSERDSTRARAVRGIGESGHPDALRMLAPALLDPSARVQLEAIDAVVGIVLAPAPDRKEARPFRTRHGTIAAAVFEAGPLAVLPRAVPADVLTQLVEATKGADGRVRISAALALGVLASPSMGRRPDGLDTRLVTDLVYGLQHRDAQTRAALVRASGRIFAPAGAATVPVAIGDALIAAMNDADRQVRVAACEALGWVREGRAWQALVERVAYYRTGAEATAALHALARLAPPGAGPTFREYVGHRETALRVMAIEGLGRLHEGDTVAEITRAVGESRDPAVGLAAAFAFYQLGERANIDRLVAALVVPELEHQARAYLTELGPAAAPDLRQRLQQGSPLLRRAVAEVLGFSGDASVLPALESAARDEDPAAATAARQAVVRLRALPTGVRTY
jgi:HEAT repeat protein